MGFSGLASQQTVARIQAAYFAVTGIWPLVSINTFQKITGPKVDTWLVRTVGLLVTSIAIALGRSSTRQEVPEEVKLLATTSAGSLAVIELYYVGKGRISPIYLLDALLEVVFVVWWVVASRAKRS